MKITNISALQNIEKYKQVGNNDQGIKKKGAGKDQISISNEALKMFDSNDSKIRSEKVSELKEKIENGSYQVDSKSVAEKISYIYGK